MTVERRRGRGVEQDASELERRIGRRAELGEHPPGLASEREHRTRRLDAAANGIARRPQELCRRRRQRGRRRRGILRRRWRHRIRARVEHDTEQLHAAHPVDHAVMDLGEEHAPVPAVAVDLVHLPEGAAAVERLGEEAAHQLGELPVVAGGTEHVSHHVVADVEARIGLPGGMRQAERHPDHPVRVTRDQVEPRGEVGELALEVERALHPIDARDVQQLARSLEVEKRRVESGQPVAGSLGSGHAWLRSLRART